MNSSKIETLAANKLGDSLIITDLLDPHIAKKDKEPLYDGYVYIYNNDNNKNENLIGRVAVQVKGKFSKKVKTDFFYPVQKIALQKYLEEGIIFFVGSIDEFNRTTLYYLCLTPVVIKHQLSIIGNQKTKNIRFTKFPNNKNEIVNLFFNFYTDCKKQISFAKERLFSLEEINKSDLLNSISVSFSSYGYDKKETLRAFFTTPVYLYANLKNVPIPVPLGTGPVMISTRENIKAKISVSEKVYYENYTRIINQDQTIWQFGKSMSIIMTNNSRLTNESDSVPVQQYQIKVDIKFTNMLKERSKDLEFIIAVYKNKMICIDDLPININVPDEEYKRFRVEEQEQLLKKYQEVNQLFDILNIRQDINLEKLSENDQNGLDTLIEAILYKKVVDTLPDNIKTIQVITIADLKLLLVFDRKVGKKPRYRVYDYFNSGCVLQYEFEGKSWESSIYSILKKDGFLNVANINYSKIVSSYKILIAENPTIYDKANYDMLFMLSAYDEGNSKNEELLKSAEEMALWLKESDNNLPMSLKTINYYQVIKRKRELNEKEKEDLYQITEDSNIEIFYKVGAYLLLDQMFAAERHFKKLTDIEQKDFLSFPISIFWKNNKLNKTE